MIVGVIKYFFTGHMKNVFNQSKVLLINFDKQRVTEDHDYALLVLFTEFIELLLVNVFTITRRSAAIYVRWW